MNAVGIRCLHIVGGAVRQAANHDIAVGTVDDLVTVLEHPGISEIDPVIDRVDCDGVDAAEAHLAVAQAVSSNAWAGQIDRCATVAPGQFYGPGVDDLDVIATAVGQAANGFVTGCGAVVIGYLRTVREAVIGIEDNAVGGGIDTQLVGRIKVGADQGGKALPALAGGGQVDGGAAAAVGQLDGVAVDDDGVVIATIGQATDELVTGIRALGVKDVFSIRQAVGIREADGVGGHIHGDAAGSTETDDGTEAPLAAYRVVEVDGYIISGHQVVTTLGQLELGGRNPAHPVAGAIGQTGQGIAALDDLVYHLLVGIETMIEVEIDGVAADADDIEVLVDGIEALVQHLVTAAGRGEVDALAELGQDLGRRQLDGVVIDPDDVVDTAGFGQATDLAAAGDLVDHHVLGVEIMLVAEGEGVVGDVNDRRTADLQLEYPCKVVDTRAVAGQIDRWSGTAVGKLDGLAVLDNNVVDGLVGQPADGAAILDLVIDPVATAQAVVGLEDDRIVGGIDHDGVGGIEVEYGLEAMLAASGRGQVDRCATLGGGQLQGIGIDQPDVVGLAVCQAADGDAARGHAIAHEIAIGKTVR